MGKLWIDRNSNGSSMLSARRRPGVSPSNSSDYLATSATLNSRSGKGRSTSRSLSPGMQRTRKQTALAKAKRRLLILVGMVVTFSLLAVVILHRNDEFLGVQVSDISGQMLRRSEKGAATTGSTGSIGSRSLQEEQQHNKHAIPNILIFTHRFDFLHATFGKEETELLALQQNVRNITEIMHPTAQVRFLTDSDCVESIRRIILTGENHENETAATAEEAAATTAADELVMYFNREKEGMYKADLCRGAALYETGGIYLDVDLGVRLNLFDVLKPSTEFATVRVHKQSKYPGAFFQAFVAVTPRHVVMYRYVLLFLQYYRGTLVDPIKGGPLGVLLLKRAYDEIQAEQEQQAAAAAATLSLSNNSNEGGVVLSNDADAVNSSNNSTITTHLESTTEIWQEALYRPELQTTILSHVPPPNWGGSKRACHFVVLAAPKLPLVVPLYSRIAGSRMCPVNKNNAANDQNNQNNQKQQLPHQKDEAEEQSESTAPMSKKQ